MIRYYSVKLSQLAGKPVIVENKPGALGNIATEYVVRAKPDGYTIMITPASSTLAAASSIFKKLPFDPQKDLAPVVLLTKLGFVFAIDAKSPIKTMAELTDMLRKKPGNGAYGTGANTGIVAAELYNTMAGLKTNQVIYKGMTEHLADLYGGQIDYGTFDPTAVYDATHTGKLRALAITSATRSSSYPDTPTMQEAGFPGYDLTPWIGLVVPAGTPQPIIDKLAAWHRQINDSNETKKVLMQMAMDPLNGDAAAMAERLKNDIGRWAEFVRISRIEAQ